MRHDIHEISNELYTQKQQAQLEKQRRENTKKLKINSILILREEIENYILDLNTNDFNDIQLSVLDNQDIIIDNASNRIVNTSYCGDSKDQIRQYLKDKFLSQFKIYFKEYKERHVIKEKISKEKSKEIYNIILDKLMIDFTNINNQQKYDMKIVLKNMYSEEYINDIFNYLDLNQSIENKEIYYKALSEMKKRKKDTIKEIKEKKKKIPLGWKCYGVLKAIDKLIK